MLLIELGSRCKSPSMYARATGDSPFPPSTPLSCTAMPTAEARKNPMSVPTRTPPADPVKPREGHVVVGRRERPPERGRLGAELPRNLRREAALARAQRLDHALEVDGIAEQLGRSERKP